MAQIIHNLNATHVLHAYSKTILHAICYTQLNAGALHENVEICCLCTHSDCKWPYYATCFNTTQLTIQLGIETSQTYM